MINQSTIKKEQNYFLRLMFDKYSRQFNTGKSKVLKPIVFLVEKEIYIE